MNSSNSRWRRSTRRGSGAFRRPPEPTAFRRWWVSGNPLQPRYTKILHSPKGFTFNSAEEIWNEVRAVWPAGAGITYATCGGLSEGDSVRIDSRHGTARLTIEIKAGIRPGELFATFHSPEVFINRVTGLGLDPTTHTPEYKRTAVRISR